MLFLTPNQQRQSTEGIGLCNKLRYFTLTDGERFYHVLKRFFYFLTFFQLCLLFLQRFCIYAVSLASTISDVGPNHTQNEL